MKRKYSDAGDALLAKTKDFNPNDNRAAASPVHNQVMQDASQSVQESWVEESTVEIKNCAHCPYVIIDMDLKPYCGAMNSIEDAKKVLKYKGELPIGCPNSKAKVTFIWGKFS